MAPVDIRLIKVSARTIGRVLGKELREFYSWSKASTLKPGGL